MVKEFQSFIKQKALTRNGSIDLGEGKMFETEKLIVQDFDKFVLGDSKPKSKPRVKRVKNKKSLFCVGDLKKNKKRKSKKRKVMPNALNLRQGNVIDMA